MLLTEKERQVVTLLAEAYNLYCDLHTIHASDREEFTAAIHKAQNIVMSRPVARELRELREQAVLKRARDGE